MPPCLSGAGDSRCMQRPERGTNGDLIAFTAMILSILLNAYSAAGLCLLYLAMRTCFEVMAYRSGQQHNESERNIAIRYANLEKRKMMLQKASNIKLRDLIRR